jgi:hypothetical protein
MDHYKHAISKCDMYLMLINKYKIQNIQALKVHTHAYVCMCVACVYIYIYIYKDQTKTKCTRQIVKEDNKFKRRKKPQ